MIEEIIKAHLESALGLSVTLETPEIPSPEYVVFEMTGASKKDLVNTSTLAVQSIAPTLYHAAQLNDRVCNGMETLVSRPEIYSCRLINGYNFTDTKTKKYRYQSVFQITY